MIIGVDEVGRGSWAGPVCVAAVAWPQTAVVTGLNDSKLLSAKRRLHMAGLVRNAAANIGIGWASPKFVDTFGLAKALQHAAQCAVSQVAAVQAPIIVDGNQQLLGETPAQYIIKADATIPAVMAASVIAKVARDTYMAYLDNHLIYKTYQFGTHVGYGTAAHKLALAEHGPCDQHRFSFAPIRALVA